MRGKRAKQIRRLTFNIHLSKDPAWEDGAGFKREYRINKRKYNNLTSEQKTELLKELSRVGMR